MSSHFVISHLSESFYNSLNYDSELVTVLPVVIAFLVVVGFVIAAVAIVLGWLALH